MGRRGVVTPPYGRDGGAVRGKNDAGIGVRTGNPSVTVEGRDSFLCTREPCPAGTGRQVA